MPPTPPRRNILVVYHAAGWPLRATIEEHLYAFRRHAPHRVFHVNLAVRRLPRYLGRVPFDLILFHTIFLSRWDRPAFRRLMDLVEPLRNRAPVLAALPQDEFLGSDLLAEFIHRLRVTRVFPVSPEETWPQIYEGVDRHAVRFERVLTGYLEPATVARLHDAARVLDRPLDVGYRAFAAPPWLGSFGVIKADLARVFGEAAPRHGLSADISTRGVDTLHGADWHRFLLRCKYTIGVEGGSGILDRDGGIKRCTEDLLARRPDATFADCERACFPGRDGSLALAALSPRHLEACATRTCQVLVKGHYNGILAPGLHYLELERDFSNLDEVLATMKRDGDRRRIVERAYHDVVGDPRYGYPSFVTRVLDACLPDGPAPRDDASWDELCVRASRDDRRSWHHVRLLAAMRARVRASRRWAATVVHTLRRRRDGGAS
jgi:hypothetical protein